jgi:cohesin complex subunit SA-1/2
VDHVSEEVSEEESGSEPSQATPRSKRASKGTRRQPAKRRKTRGAKADASDGQDATSEAGDHTEEACALYQAILEPETSLDTLVSDFIDSYKDDAAAAMTELIQMVLNACGTKQNVTSFDIEDVESVPATLMQFQEHLTGAGREKVRTTTDSYPLISRDRRFKGFRKQLCDFAQNLVSQCRDRKILFEHSFSLMQVFETWTVSMSSSTLRAFRHTSTTICLATMTALTDCQATLMREVAALQRQQATLQKTSQKTSAKQNAIKGSLKAKDAESSELKMMLNNYFDSVFVHRYRDVDGKIRSECIKELGLWMQRLPSVFLQGTYLRYLGWMLSDISAPTRLEVVKTLSKLYSADEYTANLRHFTSKFKDRLLTMASMDADLPVRCSALQMADKMRLRGLLEDDDVEILLPSVMDVESRVREAVRPLLYGVLQERSSALKHEVIRGASQGDDVEDLQFVLKALASILQELATGEQDRENASKWMLASNRTAIDTAALNFVKSFHDVTFQNMSACLLRDGEGDPTVPLTDADAAVLLPVLLAVAESALSTAKSDAEDEQDQLRDSILSTIPQLLQKYTDPSNIVFIIRLCMLIDGSAFADTRAQPTFQGQLSSLAKLFMTHREAYLLRDLGQCFLHFALHESLARFVEDLIMDLMHEVRETLLTPEADNELEVLLLRMSILSGVHDCVDLFERPEPLVGIIRRATSTFNAQIALHARDCLRNYSMWKVKAAQADHILVEGLQELRNGLIVLYKDQIATGQLDVARGMLELQAIYALCEASLDPSATELAVKTVAQSFMKAAKKYGVLSGHPTMVDVDALSRALALDDEDGMSDSDDEDEVALQANDNEAKLKLEFDICSVAGIIIRAVTMKQMDAAFASLLTANKGKLGASFDRILKELPVS